MTNQSFFNLVQAHVGESVQSALATMNMPSPNVMGSSCGTALLVQPERMSKEGWLQQMAFPSVSTGKSQKDAQPQATQTGTGASDAESQGMELKCALKQRRLEPLSLYRRKAWTTELSCLGLLCKYPSVIQGFANGFNLGIPPIRSTYAPENHHSIQHLLMPYNDIVECEFATSQYIGPFTCEQVEANLGPFQTSPLSLVPKTSKPGKFQAVHNFSHPHNPLPEVTSINSQIDGNDFPCTWGTFTAVALLIACLPPDSQASMHDVAEAYRTIPIAPSQWPGLVIRLQPENQFVITSASPQPEVYMDLWQMLGQIYSREMASACWQSGSMTTFSSGYPGYTYPNTTHAGQTGAKKSAHMGAAGRTAAASGTEAKTCQMVPQRSSMRIAAPHFVTWQMPLPVPWKTKSSPTLMQTSMRYQSALEFGGRC